MGNVNRKPRPKSLLFACFWSCSSRFTCEICSEPLVLPNRQFKNGNQCAHPYCTKCMIKYIQANLQGNIFDIKCPALNCGHSIDPLSCHRIITNQLFDKWCDMLCNSAVLGLDWVYCSALIINECGDLERCVCPNCKKPFCFRCKIPWHDGYTCEESGEIIDQNDIAFGELSAKIHWMRCPRCRHCVELVEGCSFLRCR
ncbi:E3 ubiquitin-protein ligase RSL1-like [Bidens hawaiensis]|uniref:E3 ubiquitin-protein ligase RSL1-like n=1 Tax=Bidens hawaiensis TaxID=980011 RepID=UPI00404BA095